MWGTGDILAPKLISAIGNAGQFHNGKALIAYAGIDIPPYQSDKFIGRDMRISKRGSAALQKISYEAMDV